MISYAILIVGLVLAVVAPSFMLRTRIAANLFGWLLVAMTRFSQEFGPLSRVGRIVCLIIVGLGILAGLLVPALEPLVPLAPQTVQFLGFLQTIYVLVILLLLAYVLLDPEVTREQDKGKKQE